MSNRFARDKIAWEGSWNDLIEASGNVYSLREKVTQFNITTIW